MIDNNKAVITTKYITNYNSDIISVYHDLEDDWQFMGKEDVTENDAIVLSIGQILHIDSSVNEVLNIGIGYSAHRKTKTDSWRIQKDE
jgi:hypothetical protein